MSILVVGLSHKSAPMATLERAVLTGDARVKLLRDVLHAEDVAGSMVAEYLQPGGDLRRGRQVSQRCRGRLRAAGPRIRGAAGELTPHLYVHYEDRARAASARGDLRPGLDGGRREPDPRPGPPGPHRGQGAAARSTGPCRGRRPGPAHRQARPRRDRHRPGRAPAWSTSAWPPPRPSWAQPVGDGRRMLAGRGSVLVVGAGLDELRWPWPRRQRAGAAAITVANRTRARRPAAGRHRRPAARPT